MYIEHVEKLNKDSLLCEEVFQEVFSLDSEYDRESIILKLHDRAIKLKCETKFKKMLAAYKKDLKRMSLQVSEKPSYMTEFDSDDDPLSSGSWRATEQGVWILTDRGKSIACSHPIYIRRILINAETGIHKAEIKFKVRGRWREVFIDRKALASRSAILQLADYGVQVTSENAGLLVQYLSDLEASNPSDIPEQTSTSRLGWINETTFMPYGQEVVFDNEQNLRSLFDSISQVGSRSAWYDCIKKIRKSKRIEILIYIAASLASVLVEPCGALPFVVDLWGDTGKGKTVALMVATSIWADPNEGAYMTDAKATTTAMEIRLNVLNSLPMTLDDMAQIKNQYDEDFSALVYRWCAGKGRDRSNRDLGLNKLTSWHNCILTNAEHSLVTETMQGGAINRIIDVEMSDKALFKNGNEVADLVRHNFGFCGREFVERVQIIGFDGIRQIQKKYVELIQDKSKEAGADKEEKQILPMSIILTADEIAEEYLFQDGIRLDFNDCLNLLKNKGEVSEHKRAYQYLKETIAANMFRFNVDEADKVETWGLFDEKEEKATIIGKQFDKIMSEAGFQTKAFLSWAKKHMLLKTDLNGNPKVQVKINKSNCRCVVLDLSHETESETFMDPTFDDIPFD